MSVERNLIISVLKLTKDSAVLAKNVKDDAKLPMETTYSLLAKLQSEDLLNLNGDVLEVSIDDRLKLAVKAVSLGADVQHVSDLLCWQEFEEIAGIALKNNGYIVQNNVRFKHSGHKWEIDVVGCKKPLVVCIDCKHWQRGMTPSVLTRIVDAQTERTRALAEACPNVSFKLDCQNWANAKFIPAVLSLTQCTFKFFGKVPIVPILQVQDFLSQLPAYTDSLKFFAKSFEHLGNNF